MTVAAHPLDRTSWTEADYHRMGWHDSRVHALSLTGEPRIRLLLDLDYVMRHDNGTFWVAPATLVFERPWGIAGGFGPLSEPLDIADIHRLPSPDGHPEPVWHVEGHNFAFELRAAGYRQHLRRPPAPVPSPALTWEERGGVGF
ncbi:hypothetical protein Ade02nite_68690 [Paractinoplanes deccanensis]|uniref:Uncharacterized protein n=1 Tax=Paractinoplanes deccanensis TaxID=113561 RepID=A0ABQ3YE04_9ACTN|nr:hypothetical protein [Actinoplanes deccanensis]GID78228.1 hypothetical protein Ade02nite_68690 [Actinoplanes deccanensis]